MAKFHINNNGTAGKCSAQISCPFGDLEEQHWDTAAEARAAYEESQAAWGPIMAAQRKTTLTPRDFGDVAKVLYDADPDWTWTADNRQKTIPWENLGAQRMLELVHSAEGLAAFINNQERDVTFSAFTKALDALSLHGNKIEMDDSKEERLTSALDAVKIHTPKSVANGYIVCACGNSVKENYWARHATGADGKATTKFITDQIQDEKLYPRG